MAVLHDMQLPGFSLQQSEGAKQMLAVGFWRWFSDHGDDTVFSTKVFGFIRIEIKVRQLEVVFARIFGPRPQ